MAITYFPDDVTILGGDLVLGNTGPSPASGTPVKGTLTIQAAGNSTYGDLVLQLKTAGGTFWKNTIHSGITQAADLDWTWPVAYPAGAGYALVSSTAGVFSFAAMTGGGTVSGTGTSNHIAKFDTAGTGIEDSGWIIADTTDKMTGSNSNSGSSILSVTNTSTGTSSSGISGAATGATGATLGVYGANSSSDNQAYAGGFLALNAGAALWSGGAIDLSETATPADPASGKGRLYAYTDGTLHYINDASVDTDLTAGGSGWDGTGNFATANGATIDTATGVANTFSLRGYATTGGTYVTLLTLTNAAFAPTLDFPTGATWNGNYIYHATGTDVPITDGGTGQSTAPLARIALTAEDRTVMLPVAVLKTNATSTSITTSDLGVVSYYGRAYASVASGATVTLTGIVTTAWVTAGTTPWCEVAILKGTRPARGANPTLTCVGTLAIASAAGTGVKDYVITLTANINAGDELWVGSGSKATTTRMAWRSGLADEFVSGMVASKGTLATFSGLGSTPTAFTVDSTSSTPVFYLYLPS